MKKLKRTLESVAIAAVLTLIAGSAFAGAGVAAAGACAEPRELARQSDPGSFDIAGSPARPA